MNWRSKRTVLIGVFGICLLVFIGGMSAAWVSRNHTICRDGKPPLEQQGGLLGQLEFRCHNGQIVTTPG